MNISRRTFAAGAAFAAVAGVSRLTPAVAQTPAASGDYDAVMSSTDFLNEVGVIAPWMFVEDLPVEAEGELVLESGNGDPETFTYDRFSLTDDLAVAEIAMVAEFALGAEGSGTYQLGDRTVINFGDKVFQTEMQSAEDTTMYQTMLVMDGDEALGVHRTLFDGFTQSRSVMFQAPVDNFVEHLEAFMASVFINDEPVWTTEIVDPAEVEAALDALVTASVIAS